MADSEEFLRNIVRNKLNELKYENPVIECKPLCSAGANYTSEIYEITVTDENKETLYLFAKISASSPKLRKECNFEFIFRNESNVYEKLSKAYEKIQDKYEIPKKERYVFPQFFESCLNEDREALIIENLSPKGYKTLNRLETLDYQCAMDISTVLAKFHALGFALEKKYPEIYAEFETDLYEKTVEPLLDAGGSWLQSRINSLDEQYHERLNKFIEQGGFETFKAMHKSNFAKRTFLLHGDFKASNIMYKREGEKMVYIPVDFQTVHTGTCMFDLLKFIALGTDETFRVQHFNELIDHYYEQLTNFLSKLNIDVNDVYPKELFLTELKEALPGSLAQVLIILPITLVDSETAPAIDNADTGLNELFVKSNALALERQNGYVRDCIRWGVL